MNSIRERLTAIQYEARPHLDLHWREGDSRSGTFHIAWRSALLGVIPTLATIAVVGVISESFVKRMLASTSNVIFLLMASGAYVVIVGVLSGRVAHRFAYETNISSRRLSLLMVWVANLSLWGWTWLLVLFVMSRR